MSKFTHEGVEITLDGTGKFVADLNGTRIVRSSIDAVKKAINEGRKAAFEPFDALVRRKQQHGKPIKGLKGWFSVRIVNVVVRTTRRKYGGVVEDVTFVTDQQDRYDHAYEDTPEMRRIAKEKEDHDDATQARYEADRKKDLILANKMSTFALDKTGKRTKTPKRKPLVY